MASVMMPSPPISIRNMSTTLPRGVKVAGMSTVESPVTLTALTATKNASIHEMPPWVEAGSFSSRVPSIITKAKLTTRMRGSVRLKYCLKGPNRCILRKLNRHHLADSRNYSSSLACERLPG